MATIEERLAALEALLGMSEGETPYVSQYSGPDIDEGIELARSGTVRKTGGTMTGNLTIQKAAPAVLFSTGGTSSARILKNASDNSDYGVQVEDTTTDGTKRRLTFRAGQVLARTASIIDSDNTTYQLYGEHNKPTAADTGAVAKAGDIMAGQLRFQPANATAQGRVYKNVGSNGTDYGTYMVDTTEDNGVYAGFRVIAREQKLRAFFRPEGATADTHVDVLHTGNMDSLISSLRIATGTYTGTGTYGGTVTLTCGFKPAFAIVYQADANDLSVSEEDGGWSSTFAVLVPTATGRKINIGQTSVSVKSGDTYLEITSSAHELNQNIAYNYIIVGLLAPVECIITPFGTIVFPAL